MFFVGGGVGRSWGGRGEVMERSWRSWGGRGRVVGWSVGCFKYLPTRGVFRGVFFLKSVENLQKSSNLFLYKVLYLKYAPIGSKNV